jgi:DNA-binding transcriptional regulator YdaS (Cro superfamily)
MDFAQYIRISNPRERQRLARTCGTTVAYLYQIAGHHRRAGVPLAMKLETATGGAVCRCTLRPDIFIPEDCHHRHRIRQICGKHNLIVDHQHLAASGNK